MQEISVREAARELTENPTEVILLDVREPHELEAAAVEGVVHIPMQQIPERLAELDKDRKIMCMCHAGGRSAQVGRYLAEQGYSDVYNVTGGIDAWACEVDSRIPRY